MNAITYAHLPRYTRPDHFADFADFDRRDYFVAYGRHRDSDSITRSNFACILAALDGESDTVIVIRDSHFLVGWCEAIYVHESDTARCEIADALLGKLEDYPIVNEDAHSELEWNEACEYWEHMSVKERVYYLQRAGICIFAARRAELPEDDRGYLFELLTMP